MSQLTIVRVGGTTPGSRNKMRVPNQWHGRSVNGPIPSRHTNRLAYSIVNASKDPFKSFRTTGRMRAIKDVRTVRRAADSNRFMEFCLPRTTLTAFARTGLPSSVRPFRANSCNTPSAAYCLRMQGMPERSCSVFNNENATCPMKTSTIRRTHRIRRTARAPFIRPPFGGLSELLGLVTPRCTPCVASLRTPFAWGH